MFDSDHHPRNAIEVQDLTKVYPPSSHQESANEALKGVSLVVPRGSLFGLLGPNGAGKSTLINIIAGLTVKSAGEVRVWNTDIDEDPRRARSLIGVVPQELNIDPFFSARELLEFQAGLYGVPPKERITDQLLDMVELTSVAKASSRSLSGGMRRRLMVAKAMVHRPPILILDEPTAGVDVELRKTLWDQIRKLRDAGTTILLTTHYLEEAQALCDQIVILNQGQIVANDTKSHLLAQLDKKHITITVDRDLREVPPNMKPHGWVLDGARKLHLSDRPKEIPLGQMLLAVQVNGLNITDIVTQETSLEDIFLQLTQSA